MAVVGSNITVDLHITGEVELDAIRGAVRSDSRLHPKLAEDIRRAIERQVTLALQERDITDYDLSLNFELAKGRVPGATQERIQAFLDAEGDNSVISSVDEAVGTPERARVASAVEEVVDEYLDQHGLSGEIRVTVSVTPIEFR